MYRHRPKDAHTFIGRTRVPVHISGIGFGLPCPEDLNFQPIYLLNDIGYINLKPAISSKQTVFIGNFPPIEPHVGPIANRSEEHTSELQSRQYLVCRLLLE